MTIRIGINGFGRIGRSVLRASLADPAFAKLEVVAINDPAPTAILAHLFKYDSVMGPMKGTMEVRPGEISLPGRQLSHTRFSRPEEIPWDARGVHYVLEASGRFADREQAAGHLSPGVQRVVISAPATGALPTLVLGVNEGIYRPEEHRVVSNASCTTNCAAQVIRVLQEAFGVRRGFLNTIHAYTTDQRILDAPHEDFRRARAGALSMIPTRTKAAQALGLVFPELTGRFDGISIRVPTPNVSLLEAVVELERAPSLAELDQLFRARANRYLGYCTEPLVSVDFQGDPRSAIVDGASTRVLEKGVRILAWYDNEWGYANRLLDLVLHLQGREETTA